VMSLWFVAFQGSTPIGGPIIGAVMAGAGARAGLGVGAVTCFVAAGFGALFLRRHPAPATHAAPVAAGRHAQQNAAPSSRKVPAGGHRAAL